MRPIIRMFWSFIAMICTTISASAYDIQVDGINYDVISLTDLTCAVTHGKYEGDVVIPSEISYNSRTLSVIAIRNNAFNISRSLKSVTIPNSVTEIGESAFYYCGSLESVTIPNSVTEIGESAFRDCWSLKSVTIPNSVTKIGESTFCHCRSLESVTIPNSVTEIGQYAFSDCRSLTSIVIPNSVTEIERNAFDGCKSLESVTIPNSVTEIKSETFNNCFCLTSVVIPNSVTKIGEYAFCGCTSLTSIIIPNSVTEIGEFTFYNCRSLDSVSLSEKLTSLPSGIFHKCSSLKSLKIPGSVNIFYQCYDSDQFKYYFVPNLHRLELDYSPAELSVVHEGNNYSEYDFWSIESLEELYINRPLKNDIYVRNLKKLEIGKNLKEIQVYNIDYYSDLTTIYSNALTPPTLPELSNKQYMDVMVYVPEEAIDAYRNAESWKNFWNLTPVSGIGDVEIDIDSDAPVHIYSINGMEMKGDTESLPAGIYILRQGTKTKKFVVNR